MPRVYVIGATSGIAAAVAGRYAAQGAQLRLLARVPEAAQALARSLTARGAHEIEILPLDIESIDASERTGEAICRDLESADEAIVYVGIGTLEGLAEAPGDARAATRLVDINFRNLVALVTPIAEALRRRGHGSLILVSSVSGERGRQSNYVYGAAKAGWTAFASGLRNRLHPAGVHVLTVIPGYVDTRMLRASLGDTAVDKLPAWLLGQPDAVAMRIVDAEARKRDVIYVPGIWRWAMCVIKSIPERIFKRMSL